MHRTQDVIVRPCDDAAVAIAEACMPTGANGFHQTRHEQQTAGQSTHLLAWRGDEAVGHLNLLRRSKYDVVVERLGPFPEMNALGVVQHLQGRGIGTALIRAVPRR